ncbi:AsnC family transcriptional regulator [Magnetospirillum sp. UT-4]|uniref:siroheme decarboxylase subunit beta n=1 Tax=Magnetospirillum sp. UT-4 TaxID=2681467 RepID=UPI0013833588|nr:AsnC family transcriptional regulator [Magnetospirillum sp. UT-4]CAA7624268.1 Protein NirH [Magnetospirillum sp. UT-4]
MDAVDRAIILATQAGLPLTPQPYHKVAETVGIAPEEVMARLARMLAEGVVRRIGAVPDHYALGYRHNGMTVWDVADDEAEAAGEAVAALPFVSHCYLRPRRPPFWPYNLFAMIHARDPEAAAGLVAEVAAVLGPRVRAHQVLYSSRILKKTGVRLAG